MNKLNFAKRACAVLALCVATAIALPAQSFKVLYSFYGQTDGAEPYAGLIQATDGNFYGTTAWGGPDGEGDVFKITPSGTVTILYTFWGTDGADPYAGLMEATDGNFYGTTRERGLYWQGTVFKITPSGTLTTMYSFCSQSDCVDGEYPEAGLIQATDGNFYGTTEGGGAFSNGTVFKITPTGTLTTLHSFDGTDGQNPYAALIQATDGNFYGTTWRSGAHDYGTVFKITPSGTLTTLHSLDQTDGEYPCAALIQATNGRFYGTTWAGGEGSGTIFMLSIGFVPFVETEPISGRVGQRIKILGSNVTGATSVTFNGTSAAFSVVSRSPIKATVPAGATTGTVEVTTPGGVLSSNVPFRVLP